MQRSYDIKYLSQIADKLSIMDNPVVYSQIKYAIIYKTISQESHMITPAKNLATFSKVYLRVKSGSKQHE